MELNDRVRKARHHAKLTQEQLVERIRHLPGVKSFTQQALNKLENGDTLKSAFLPHIAHICGVDAGWLTFEIGDMTEGLRVAEPGATYQAQANLKPDEETLLNAYRKLDKSGKHAVITTALHGGFINTAGPSFDLMKMCISELNQAIEETGVKLSNDAYDKLLLDLIESAKQTNFIDHDNVVSLLAKTA